MSKPKALKLSLTTDELPNAVYLHLDGWIGETPSLAGALWLGSRETRFEQSIFDKGLLGAAKAKSIGRVDFGDYLADLVRWTEGEDRVIVGWGRGSIDAFRQTMGAKSLQRLEHRYRDGARLAKEFARQANGNGASSGRPLPPTLSLDEWMHYFGIEVANGANGIATLREQLTTGATYDELSPAAKSGWTRVLARNQDACFAMRRVCRQLATLTPQANGRRA